MRLVVTLSIVLYVLGVAHGFTVLQCTDSEECCQCPQPSQYWSNARCERYYDSQTPNRWPSPHNETCEIEIVPTCSVNGVNTPVTMTPDDMDASVIANTNDLYRLLSVEYAASLINTAKGFNSCVKPSEQFDSVLSKGTKTGERITVNLKQDVMDKAFVLLTLYCQDRFIEASKEQDAEWLTSILRGFNNGWLFSNATSCAIGGDIHHSLGSVHGDGNVACDVGCTWTKTPSEWLQVSCVAGHGRINKHKCQRWPGSTEENPTRTESTFLCGETETYSGVLSLHDNSAIVETDAWVRLGGAYVAALLNREKGVCVTGPVDNAMTRALSLLRSSCPCRDPSLLGQEGCTHEVPDALDAAPYDQLVSILSDYNSGMFAYGDDYHHVKAPLTALEMISGGESSECCSGGCTRDYAYYLSRNCHVHHGGSENRIAWPGGEDDDCSTIPNVEDKTDLCGYSNIEILNTYTTSIPVDKQDSWSMLARAYIVTKLNIDAGACMTNVATRYSSAENPWLFLSMSDVVDKARDTLLSSCSSVGSVGHNTPLGMEMHAMRVVLDDFTRGNYGPGACYPNDMLSACNSLQVEINLPHDKDTSLVVTPNSGYSRAQCPISSEPDTCCTKTSHYWATHNIDAPLPRNVTPWPKFLCTASCDHASDVCYNAGTPRGEGSVEVDPVAHDIAQVLHFDPVRIAPPYPDGDTSFQEHTSFCSSNVSGTYLNVNRPLATRMVDLLVRSERGDFSRDETLTLGQRKWIRLANAFTVAMLNTWTIHDGNCPDTLDNILERIVELEGYIYGSVNNPHRTRYLKHTSYLQTCLFDACQLNPEQDIPSLPKKHLHSGHMCDDGFYSVVNALEEFSNGKQPPASATLPHGTVYHHCYEAEPPTKCQVGSKGRGACDCVNTRHYYSTHYQGHEDSSFDVRWPVVMTSDTFKEGHFPREFVPSHQAGIHGLYSEDFSALTCPTAYSTKDITWFDIMMDAGHLYDDDAYLPAMKEIVPAWLNAFKGACMPSDVFATLMEATTTIGQLVRPGGSHAFEMCISPSLGTRAPVDKESSIGMKLTSMTRVLKSFNEGYHGSHACMDLCSLPGAPDCGKRGMCQPDTGMCVCDSGYTGTTCQYSECGGNGWYQGGQCICAMGWTGANCDKCGIPANFIGDSYICMPCNERVCGVQGEYILEHAPAVNVSDWMRGVNLPPVYKGTGYLPVMPGTEGLDCGCNRREEILFLTRSINNRGSTHTQNNNKRVFKFNNNKDTALDEEAMARTPSRSERIIADFESMRELVKQSGAVAKQKKVDGLKTRVESRLSPRDPHASYQDVYPFRGHLVQMETRQQRSVSHIAQRDLCDTQSEQTTIEDFLLLCLEQQVTLQTQMEESSAMCLLSIESCELTGNETCSITLTANSEYQENLNDDVNDTKGISTATLVIVSVILFGMIVLGALLCCLLLGIGRRNSRLSAINLSRETARQQSSSGRMFAGAPMNTSHAFNNTNNDSSVHRTGQGTMQRRR